MECEVCGKLMCVDFSESNDFHSETDENGEITFQYTVYLYYCDCGHVQSEKYYFDIEE